MEVNPWKRAHENINPNCSKELKDTDVHRKLKPWVKNPLDKNIQLLRLNLIETFLRLIPELRIIRAT